VGSAQARAMRNHAVIIPAYNEEKNIRKLLEAVSHYDIIAVVDGNDRTANIAKKYCVKVLTSKEKRGYGQAIIDGLVEAYCAGYDIATVMDVGTCDPDFLYVYTKDTDIIVRARYEFAFDHRVILSKLAALALTIATLSPVPDATTGYRTYNLQRIIPILSQVKTNGHTTNFEILGLALKNRLRVKYFPVPYTLDENSQLKAKDLLEALKCTIRLLFTPQLST